jgi:polar amino acid transport system substrate-binding protein
MRWLSLRNLLLAGAVMALLGSTVHAGSNAVAPEKKTLVVGTKHVPPFAVKKPDGTWAGISIELWREIAAALDLDYQLREMTLEEMLEDLRSASIDAAVAALTVTAEREQTMDFTHPFHTSGLGIAVSGKNKAGWLAVIEGFLSLTFLKVVLVLAAVLFVAGLLVWVFERRRNPEQFGGDVPKGLGAAFWWSAVTMTTVGYGDKAPQTFGGRMVALVWMFTSVIIISSFTASITSALTVKKLELSVQGPEDLPKVRVVTVRGSTSETYLRNQRITARLCENPLEGLRSVAAGEADAMVYDAPVLRYLITNEFRGTLEVLPQKFERQYYAIGLPEGSGLREPINRVLVEKTSQAHWQDVLYRYLGD